MIIGGVTGRWQNKAHQDAKSDSMATTFVYSLVDDLGIGVLEMQTEGQGRKPRRPRGPRCTFLIAQ